VEDQLYVRIRGRVQGPFDAEKLRALVRRGQLSRMHEVSLDGNDWKQASEYSELFATEAKQVSEEPETVPEDGQPAAQEAIWYYSVNGVQVGPVTFAQLQSQASPGHLSSDDLVWKEGMKEWVPGSAVPGLLFRADPPTEEPIPESTASSGKLGGEIIRTLKDSQAWVRFIAFSLFLFCFLSFMGGTYLIIRGFLFDFVRAIALGIYFLLYAAVFFYGGWLLHSFRGHLRRFGKERSITRLDQAFQKLRTFWVFISIILIIVLVNGIAAVIYAIPFVDFPQRPM
jgi:hypothetical protein